MKKIKYILSSIFLSIVTWNCKTQFVEIQEKNKQTPSIHQFVVNDISGKEFKLSSLKGKK